MKTSRTLTRHRGYTLVELSLVMVVGLMIASMLMVLVNQQFAFLKIYRAQNFLAEEAPVINNQLARIIDKADRFRVHTSIQDALDGKNAVMSGGSAVALYFRQPDGTTLKAVIGYGTPTNMSRGLYYYTFSSTGVQTTPDWAITKRPTNVTFAITEGILRTTMTGPSNEQITYSGTMQQ